MAAQESTQITAVQTVGDISVFVKPDGLAVVRPLAKGLRDGDITQETLATLKDLYGRDVALDLRDVAAIGDTLMGALIGLAVSRGNARLVLFNINEANVDRLEINKLARKIPDMHPAMPEFIAEGGLDHGATGRLVDEIGRLQTDRLRAKLEEMEVTRRERGGSGKSTVTEPVFTGPSFQAEELAGRSVLRVLNPKINSEVLAGQMKEEAMGMKGRVVVVNLASVTYLDDTGLGKLLGINRELKAMSRELRLVLSAVLSESFRDKKVLPLFKHFTREDDALAA